MSLTAWLNDLYVLNVADGVWQPVAVSGTSPSPRDKLRSVAISQTKFLLFGGFGPQQQSEEGAENEDEDQDLEVCVVWTYLCVRVW